MSRRSIRFYFKRFIGGILQFSFVAASEGGQQDHHSRSDLLLHRGLLRALRRLFLAFPAIIFVTGAGCTCASRPCLGESPFGWQFKQRG